MESFNQGHLDVTLVLRACFDSKYLQNAIEWRHPIILVGSVAAPMVVFRRLKLENTRQACQKILRRMSCQVSSA